MNDPNCLSFWFPKLRSCDVAVPETIIRRADCDLGHLLDGRKPDGLDDFLCGLRDDMDRIPGPPWFLRTGHSSFKHEWKKTCFVEDGSIHSIGLAVANMVDHSFACDLPVDVWAVREFIQTRPKFLAFEGMPISREHRLFFANGKVICNHPYWPLDAISNPSIPKWRYHLQNLHETPAKQLGHLAALTWRVAREFEGAWSIDWLKSLDGVWFAIDMSLARNAWHWPDCPHVGAFNDARSV